MSKVTQLWATGSIEVDGCTIAGTVGDTVVRLGNRTCDEQEEKRPCSEDSNVIDHLKTGSSDEETGCSIPGPSALGTMRRGGAKIGLKVQKENISRENCCRRR